MGNDIDTTDSIKSLKSNRHLFNYNSLIEYVDKINNPAISSLIRSSIYETLKN